MAFGTSPEKRSTVVASRVTCSSSSSAWTRERPRSSTTAGRASRAAVSTSARSRKDDAPRSIGACPASAAVDQDAARNSSAVRTRSAARLRTRSGSQTSTWVPRATRSVSSCIVRPPMSAGISDSMPSTAMPSASLPRISISSGVLDRQRGGAGAHLAVTAAARGTAAPTAARAARRASAGRRRRSSAARRPRRPRTPRGPGAARWAGRRRAGHRGRRTRRASRPAPRGCRRRRRARGRRRRGRPRRPASARPGRGRPGPGASGCSTLRTGATSTSIVPFSPGWVRSRSTASRRPTVSARGLSRSCGSVSQAGKVSTRRPGTKQRSRSATWSASRSPAVTTQDRHAGARLPRRERGGDQRLHRRRRGDGERRAPGRGHDAGHAGIGEDDVEHAAQGHAVSLLGFGGRTAAAECGRGPIPG